MERMEVQLTPDQEAFIRQAIETGRLHRREEALQEAMSLWEERERRRLEILMAVDQPKPRWRAARADELRRMRK
jgi:Arc/MetJ-type ribon-helix-helix transcriptional regulator